MRQSTYILLFVKLIRNLSYYKSSISYCRACENISYLSNNYYYTIGLSIQHQYYYLTWAKIKISKNFTIGKHVLIDRNRKSRICLRET